MSILHELRSLAGGGQNTLPSWRTIALLCMNPTVKSSALQQQFTSFTMSVKAKSHHAIQLANQLASWIASWSARPASELDSVMEFGLSRAVLLASSSLAGGIPARELVADLLASWIVRDRPNFITLSSSLANR